MFHMPFRMYIIKGLLWQLVLIVNYIPIYKYARKNVYIATQIFKYVKIIYQTDADLKKCSLYFLLNSLVDSMILKCRGISFHILNP